MEKESIEFRYYEIPSDMSLIALLGKEWIRMYGEDAMHFHNCLEIGYCHYGRGNMYFGKREEPYGPGCITIVPKNFPHHTRQTDEPPNRWEYLFVDLERFLNYAFPDKVKYANLLEERLNSKMFLISGEQEPELETLIKLLLDEMRKKQKFYKPCAKALLQAFLLQVARYEGNNEQNQEMDSEIANYGVVLKVLSYIENHYMENFTMKELAAMFHMSTANFRRKFHDCMHAAPIEYVTLVRIEKACELLETTEERVEEIAFKVGYHASATFIRNFKKLTGYSPLQWRKMVKQREDNLLQYNISILRGW